MATDDVEFESEDITVGNFTFSLTTIAFLPIELLMANQAKGVEISGQKVWCGSLSVAEYLLDNTQFVSNTSVVELGSGTGLIGMLCSRLGARRVALTDHDPRSIAHMTVDVETNGVLNTSVELLDWYRSEGCERLSSGSVVAEGGEGDSGFRIVAGDVLYKRDLLLPFFSTVVLLLESRRSDISDMSAATFTPVPQLLLCHVPRAGVQQADVVAAAVAMGLVVREVEEQHWKKGGVLLYSPSDDYDRAKVYIMQLC